MSSSSGFDVFLFVVNVFAALSALGALAFVIYFHRSDRR
jgi:hypothetical protein